MFPICLSSLQTTKWRQTVVFCIATTFHSLSRVAPQDAGQRYTMMLSFQTKVSGCDWVSCSKIVQAGRTRAFLGVVLLISWFITQPQESLMKTRSEFWTLNPSFWCLGRLSRWYPVNAETPTPRSWIRCTRLLRCRCRPPERSPKAGEGKVTHKVGPLGSFYMWGPYKWPHKWVTYKNWLASEKNT